MKTFRRVDYNRDNALSELEFIEGDADDDRDDLFDDLDVNNNGRVERSEWHAGTAAFNRLDRNRDGELTRFDVVGGLENTGETWDQFASLDYDNSGRCRETNGTGRSAASTGAPRTATASSLVRSSRSPAAQPLGAETPLRRRWK